MLPSELIFQTNGRKNYANYPIINRLSSRKTIYTIIVEPWIWYSYLYIRRIHIYMYVGLKHTYVYILVCNSIIGILPWLFSAFYKLFYIHLHSASSSRFLMQLRYLQNEISMQKVWAVMLTYTYVCIGIQICIGRGIDATSLWVANRHISMYIYICILVS